MLHPLEPSLPPATTQGIRSEAGCYTLVEMLTTVAALVIVFGLLVSLARDVRSRSADELTQRLLAKLDRALNGDPQLQRRLAGIPWLVPGAGDSVDESGVQQAALENNAAFVRLWRRETGGLVVRDQPLAIYDEVHLRDAWGMPIVYLPAGATNIGISPQSRAFFLSAGPDRMFTTVLDNLYSYECLSQVEEPP